MKDIGVTEEPEVYVYNQPEQYKLIAASDGLWGYMPNDAVSEIASFEQSAEIICHKLVHNLFKISRKYNYLDNTTIIVIKS
jgi:serine/threonine protein phosphatase PrpC